MQKYDFTDKAEQDLEKIVNYTLKHWGKKQVKDYIDALEEAAQMLADNPDIGLNRDTLSKGLLSFPLLSHNLYYVKTSSSITIIRILHTSMDSAKHLK